MPPQRSTAKTGSSSALPTPVLLRLPSPSNVLTLLTITTPFIYTSTQIFFSRPNLFVPIAIYFTLVNIVTFIVYTHDKRRSRIAGWRVKETTLHWFAILGGWPAAFLAMTMLSHKTRKTSFQLVFWLTVGGWLAAWWKLCF